jgi:hypothetical protein
MRSLTPPDFLIACAGERVDSRCAEAMERVASVVPYLSVRFVHSSWLASSELATATLYWVVDAEFCAGRMSEALQTGLPFLVPGERGDLKALCQSSGCAYSYQSGAEAAERIAWILRQRAKPTEGDSGDPALTRAAMHAKVGDR